MSDEEAPPPPRTAGPQESSSDGHDKGSGGGSLAVLRNVRLEVKCGELVTIVGPVGVGKTTLCSAVLGELCCLEGSVEMSGSVAYVPQTAWVINGTVKENILFGLGYDEGRYMRAIDVCAMAMDVDILPDGHETEIGERGITLSGGQKQRLSLARAVYADADIYIFDDPLSALDAEVGRSVFTHCISNEGILKGKTRLLVTHHLHYISHCDRIIWMTPPPPSLSHTGVGEEASMSNTPTSSELDTPVGGPPSHTEDGLKTVVRSGSSEAMTAATTPALTRRQHKHHYAIAIDKVDSQHSLGSIRCIGTYDELMGEPDFLAMMREFGLDEERDQQQHKQRHKQGAGGRRSRASDGGGVGDGKGTKEPKKLMTKEERETGRVKSSVYVSYVRRARAEHFAILALASFTLWMLTNVTSSYWLTLWSSDVGYERFGLHIYLVGYAAFAVVICILSFTNAVMVIALGVRASHTLHERLFANIMRAPMRFFDTTPVGRVLARFSRDCDQMDMQLPMTLNMLMTSVFTSVTSVVSICWGVPWFLLALPPLMTVYVMICIYYQKTMRELKRLESVTRSPIFAHFQQALGGLSTIRAYSARERLERQAVALADANNEAFYAYRASERWLGVRLEVLGAVVVLVTGMLLSGLKFMIPAALAGFAIAYANNMTSMLQFLVRNVAETEAMMNCVERILHYTDPRAVEQEAPYHSTEAKGLTKPPHGWPAQGRVCFDNVAVRYRKDTPLVLKGVSFDIKAGEKVGICGRTGSGKSSMLLTLFRMIECEEGTIAIDGRNIAHMGLSELRSKLAIIPQDPVLFSGSLRFNLDPFGQHTDDQLWEALTKVELADTVRTLAGGSLEQAQVAEYGENFSLGQRQLLCMARALLRRSKILVLDEATSSMDMETDRTMQRLIRSEFVSCTILTVAHRLRTIIDSDRVLVLSEGRLVELDSPATLLKQSDSVFASLVEELGRKEASALQAIAFDKQ